MPFVEIAGGLTEIPFQKGRIHVLDNIVEAQYLAIEEHLGGRFPRSRNPHLSKQLHGDPFTQVGRVLVVRLENDEGQTQQCLRLTIIGEVYVKVRFDGTSASAAMRAHANVLADSVPGEGRGIVSVQQVVLLQRGPIARSHREVDYLHGGVVEERVGLHLPECAGAGCRHSGQQR